MIKKITDYQKLSSNVQWSAFAHVYIMKKKEKKKQSFQSTPERIIMETNSGEYKGEKNIHHFFTPMGVFTYVTAIEIHLEISQK